MNNDPFANTLPCWKRDSVFSLSHAELFEGDQDRKSLPEYADRSQIALAFFAIALFLAPFVIAFFEGWF